MLNPFRSEAEAYRFLLLSVGYFAAIASASVWAGPWAGTAVFALLTLGGVVWYVRQREERPPPAPVVHRGGEDERRILVIANETVGGTRLLNEIRQRAEGYEEQVLVVCPALNSPLRHWASDDDRAREAAGERLERSLARLREGGVEVEGEVGDADPIQALEDAFRSFGPDEIIISTHPEGRSRWLEKRVVERARERFAAPITHVVVDLQAEQAGPAA